MTGTNVTLQNVELNTYDLDGNGDPGYLSSTINLVVLIPVSSDKGKDLRNTINIRSFSAGTYMVKLYKNNAEPVVSKILISR